MRILAHVFGTAGAPVTTDPKPVPRHVAERDEWDAIVLAKTGPCRGCGGPASSFHHVVPRGQRGDDVPANVIPLCGTGTTGCHGAITTHTPGWEAIASAIRGSLSPAETQYVYAKRGRWWLDRHYPHDPVLCARCRREVKTVEPTPDADPLPARRKTTWTLVVPDDAERGADVLDTLVDALADDFGFTDATSRLRRYHACVIALSFTTMNRAQAVKELSHDG